MSLSQFLQLLESAGQVRRFHYGLTFYIDYDSRLVPRRKFSLPILYRSSGKLTEKPSRPLDTIEAVYFYLVSTNKLPTLTCSHPLAAAQRIGLAQELAENIIRAANQTADYSRKLRNKLKQACGLTKQDRDKVLTAYFGSTTNAEEYANKSLRDEDSKYVGILSGEDEVRRDKRSGDKLLRESMRTDGLVKPVTRTRIIINKGTRN